MKNLQRLAELTEKLTQREAMLGMIVQQAQVGVWDWDVNTNDLHWNDNMKKIWGYTTEEPFTEKYDDFISRVIEADRDRVHVLVNSCLDGTPFRTTYQVDAGGGVIRNVTASGMVITSPDGLPIHMVGVCIAKEHI